MTSAPKPAARRGTPLPDAFDLLSVDPGRHTGWAAFGERTLWACGTGDPPVERARRVVVELPRVYPRHPVPPQDIVTLAALAGQYVGRAAAAGASASTVSPSQWKGTMPKGVCAARVRARLSPEERAVVDACGAPAGELHNVLDAVGIGLHALGRFA